MIYIFEGQEHQTNEKRTENLLDLLTEFYNQLICYLFLIFQIINQLSNYNWKTHLAYTFMVQVVSF